MECAYNAVGGMSSPQGIPVMVSMDMSGDAPEVSATGEGGECPTRLIDTLTSIIDTASQAIGCLNNDEEVDLTIEELEEILMKLKPHKGGEMFSAGSESHSTAAYLS